MQPIYGIVPLLVSVGLAAPVAYPTPGSYMLAAFAPNSFVDDMPIQASDQAFYIGLGSPQTSCFMAFGCPAGDQTLVNEKMTELKVGNTLQLLLSFHPRSMSKESACRL
jgi:hypothetical protein